LNETQQKYDYFAKECSFWLWVEDVAQKILGITKWRKNLIKSSEGNVLDVATGTGINFKYYSKNCHVFAIDISWEMLKIAQKTKPPWLKINFLLADAENLPFIFDSFDSTVSVFSLCTVDKPIKAVNEIKNVCKLDGQLLFLEHGKSSWKIISSWQNKRAKKHKKYLNCHNNRNIIQIIKKGGLNNISITKKWFGIFYLITNKK